MRKRTNETQRRMIRMESDEWLRLTSEVGAVAKELDNSSLWHQIYASPANDSEDDGQEQEWSYRRSVLWVDDIIEVQRLIADWKGIIQKMSDWQAKNEPARHGNQLAGVPPRFRQPRIYEEVVELRIYENQASTSWKVTPGEIEKRINRAVSAIELLLELESPAFSLQLCRARLNELISAQADTWMGILIARDYPGVARHCFGDLIPSQVVPEGLTDRDDAFELFRDQEKPIEDERSRCERALEQVKRYLNQLGLPEAQGAPKRIRLEHAGRKVFLRHADATTETVPLVSNGVFVSPIEGIREVSALLRDSPSGDWKRRKPNRNTLFRLGRYEFCDE
jgi:hypothetical protein